METFIEDPFYSAIALTKVGIAIADFIEWILVIYWLKIKSFSSLLDDENVKESLII
tara:strand:- start:155 stop:322 length:168 start_codon:yes stop_codon:yes gene_type:complete